MTLVTGPCKTAILQGQILATHSSVAVGIAKRGGQMRFAQADTAE
jgi:hypothetical protein